MATWCRRLLVPIAVVLLAGCAHPDRRFDYHAELKGADAVPPVETVAKGRVDFERIGDGLSFTLRVDNVQDATMAQLWVGPNPVQAETVAWLYPQAPPPSEKTGLFSGVLALGTLEKGRLVGKLAGKGIDELQAHIRAGQVYVVVFTTRHPQGELLGRVR